MLSEFIALDDSVGKQTQFVWKINWSIKEVKIVAKEHVRIIIKLWEEALLAD